MPGIENNWQLFGYDLRQAQKFWKLAWQQCLWGNESPLKAQLDEMVKVHLGGSDTTEKEAAYFHAGKRVEADSSSAEWLGCEALMLPASQVLCKIVNIPLAAESELAAVMALEVSANSPFPADDTGSGWRLLEKTESSLQIQLVIVSLGATMELIGQEYQCHDASRYEIWTMMNEVVIVIDGFGTAPRKQRYGESLFRLAAVAAYCMLILILMSALSAGSKYWELAKVQTLYERVESEASNAVRLRRSLASSNEVLIEIDKLITTHKSPHVELKRISTLLSDRAWLLNFQMSGKEIRVQGRGTNVADEMRSLTDEPFYEQVTAPRDISRIGGSGLEQFSFDIRLAEQN